MYGDGVSLRRRNPRNETGLKANNCNLHPHAWSSGQSTRGVAEVGRKPRLTSWMASSQTDAISSVHFPSHFTPESSVASYQPSDSQPHRSAKVIAGLQQHVVAIDATRRWFVRRYCEKFRSVVEPDNQPVLSVIPTSCAPEAFPYSVTDQYLYLYFYFPVFTFTLMS